jgi:acetyl-CoA C-acetyltransferase
MSDGAVAMAVCSRAYAEAHGLEVLAVVRRHLGMSGSHNSSAYLPGEAIHRLLSETGHRLADISRIEINEAFAATPLVSLRLLSQLWNIDETDLHAITNVNGGSVAVGHPLGASGARITLALVHELRRLGGGLGVAAICGGYGQTDAILIEV